MTAADFLLYHPTFATAPTALINVKLAEAELFIGDTWGDRREYMVALKAASFLADSPEGRNARLEPGGNVYEKRLKDEAAMFNCMHNRIW